MLVHGEFNEMFRLKQSLQQEYEDDSVYAPRLNTIRDIAFQDYKIDIHTPENTKIVKFSFRGEKMAKAGVAALRRQ